MRLPPRLVFPILFLPVVLLRLFVSIAGPGEFGNDPSYYTEIAEHVRDGEGLATRVSLFHHGYRSFPHPTPVYPLWPLLLGWSARVIPMRAAAVALPAFFYFVAVGFCWLWARQLPRAALAGQIGAPGGAFDTTHAAALLLAWNAPFFSATSVPLTEGLAYALLFAALFRSAALWRNRGLLSGLELGAWTAVILLVRSQLALFGIAIACTLAWSIAVVPDRRRAMLMGAGFFGAAAALVLPRYLRLAESTLHPVTALLRFEVAQANTLLSPVHVLAGKPGLLATLLDRLSGVPIAFAVLHPLAYMRAFFGLQYALPVALPFLAAQSASAVRREGVATAFAWIRAPERLQWVFLVLFAAGGFASLHLIHKDFGAEWHFGKRHALTAFVAFFLAWLALAHSPRLRLRQAAWVLLAVSLAGGSARAIRLGSRTGLGLTDMENRAELVSYLEARRVGGSLTVASASRETQRLALLTDGVNYHWLHPGTRIEDLDVLFKDLNASLLLVRHDEREPTWEFLRDRAAFDARFRQVGDLDDHAVFTIVEPRRETAGTQP